jgi:hypothetical protein
VPAVSRMSGGEAPDSIIHGYDPEVFPEAPSVHSHLSGTCRRESGGTALQEGKGNTGVRCSAQKSPRSHLMVPTSCGVLALRQTRYLQWPPSPFAMRLETENFSWANDSVPGTHAAIYSRRYRGKDKAKHARSAPWKDLSKLKRNKAGGSPRQNQSHACSHQHKVARKRAEAFERSRGTPTDHSDA